jgi:hypothetical protein
MATQIPVSPKYKTHSTLYLLALAIQIVIGFYWPGNSNGFAAKTVTGPFYCNELLSSGGDDSTMVVVFVLLFIPLLIRVFLFTRRVSIWELGTFVLTASIVVVGFYAATLDCAEFFYTAFGVPDIPLQIAIYSFLMSIYLIFRLRSLASNRP